MLDALPAAIYTTDAEGRLTHFNPACVTFSGRTPELGSDHWCVTWKLYHPDGSPMPHDECPMAVALREGRVIQGAEAIAERPDGVRVWFTPYPTPLFDEAGKVIGGINMLVDITARKRAEKALRDARAQLESELADTKLLQSLSAEIVHQESVQALHEKLVEAAVAIMRSDMGSMQMVDSDEDALRLLAFRGFEPEFGRVFEFVRPDTRTSCGAARRTGQRVIVDDVEHWDFIAGTPSLEDLRRAGIRSVQSTPLLARNGALVGVLSTHWKRPHRPADRDLRLLDILARQAADLIERKKGDEALARLAAIVTYSEDAIISKDRAGVITSLNRGAQNLFGYTAEEAIGRPVTMLIPRSHIDEEPEILWRIKRGEVVEHYETVRKRKDGSLVAISLTVSPIRDPSGAVIGASEVARNISERKRLERELKNRVGELAAADRSKSDFLAMLSHELRSPLNAIRGWVTLLQRPDVSPESMRQGLAVIDRQSRAQAELIGDLMDVQRLDSGKVRLDTSEVVLASVVDAAIDALVPIAAEKDLRIRREMRPANVRGDPTRLQQVFSNLFTNAIKFTPRGGAISIELGQAGPNVEVRVSDTGDGIDTEAMPYIFERFRQADASASRSHGGLGLGLSIVKQLVELHGGGIRVESEGKGKGATFTVTLPLHHADVAPRGRTLADETAEERPISLGGAMVLVVDDEMDAREPLRQVLEGAGAEVLAVSSVDEVLKVLEQQVPDVIVSDIAMPGRDGYALIQTIRSLSRERGGGIPAIALTAYASKQDRERALHAGYDVHLGKPVEAAELIEIIAGLAAKGSAQPGMADPT